MSYTPAGMVCCAPKRSEEDNSHRDDYVYVGKQSAHRAGSAAHVESIRQSRAADEEELDADQPEPLKTSGCLWMRFDASSNLDPELEETPTGFVLRVTQAAGDEDRVVALRVDEEEDAQAWMQW